ncbi:hypothetical protein [Lacticaseibacillus kribbianus]|uniref:hypothetical protein n=1 Tax=Lacticaseibacillus kribbianus TaxID=2926292 RepID=UPI001CD58EF2|nr:hypothetical protein [Lacticaseibacillus kribbianus]
MTWLAVVGCALIGGGLVLAALRFHHPMALLGGAAMGVLGGLMCLLTVVLFIKPPAATEVLNAAQATRFVQTLERKLPRGRVRFAVTAPTQSGDTVGFAVGDKLAVSLPKNEATMKLGTGDRVDVRVRRVVEVSGHWLVEAKLLSTDYRASFGR